ncbi:MAG: nucleotidyltransferase family protein [Anaerolineae bacterium]|nr:nucleotidyltransferase family protein [Anaerolineae bacterium]
MNVANISIPQREIRAICERHHVQKLSLFGSVLRGDFRPDSDIDVLVEYDPDVRVSLFDQVDLQLDLETVWGCKVDLGTPASLSKYIRQKVLQSAQVIYERA